MGGCIIPSNYSLEESFWNSTKGPEVCIDIKGPSISGKRQNKIRLWNLQEIFDFLGLLRLVANFPNEIENISDRQILGLYFQGDYGYELTYQINKRNTKYLSITKISFCFKDYANGDKKYYCGHIYKPDVFNGLWSSLEFPINGHRIIDVKLLERRFWDFLIEKFEWMINEYTKEFGGTSDDFKNALQNGRIINQESRLWYKDHEFHNSLCFFPRPLHQIIAETLSEENHTLESLATKLNLDTDIIRSYLNIEARYNPKFLLLRYLIERSQNSNRIVSFSTVRIPKDVYNADPSFLRLLLSETLDFIALNEDRVVKLRIVTFGGDQFNLNRYRSLNIAIALVEAMNFWRRENPSAIQIDEVSSLALRLFDLKRSFENLKEENIIEQLINRMLEFEKELV